jgi:hypothetical protein
MIRPRAPAKVQTMLIRIGYELLYDCPRPTPMLLMLNVHCTRDEALVFLLGSRYCETDRLSEIAWSLFGKTPLGWSRVQAICDYVHQRIALGYEHARATRTAWVAYCDRNRRLPGLCSPRRRLLSLHEHPGAIPHGLSGRSQPGSKPTSVAPGIPLMRATICPTSVAC